MKATFAIRVITTISSWETKEVVEKINRAHMLIGLNRASSLQELARSVHAYELAIGYHPLLAIHLAVCISLVELEDNGD